MEKFELHILGCGSALPTTRHFPTSQIVNVRDKLFMIDCGEGAQLQFRKSHLKFSRLNHMFWLIGTDFYTKPSRTYSRVAYPFSKRAGSIADTYARLF